MINWIKTRIHDRSLSNNSVPHFRESVFNIIAITLIITGFFVLLAGFYASIKHHLYILAISDFSAYVLLLYFYLSKRINLIIKKIYISLLPLMLGIILMFMLGPGGPGFIYLVGFNILVAILLGFRSTVISLSITTLILITVTGLIHFDLVYNFALSQYTSLGFFAASINVLLIGSISSLPMAFLVKNLETKIYEQEKMQQKIELNMIDLFEAKLKAEESDKLKSSFLANMSHEVRTPLNAIIGFSQLLVNDKDLSKEENNKYLKTINDSGKYLLNIIENILDISLIESKQLKFYIKSFNVHEFMLDIKRLYSPNLLNSTQATVVFKDSYLDTPIILKSDNHRLKQVLVNLINNAIKFTHEGNIEIGYRLLDGVIEFYVKDTGIGINDAIKDIIFDRFVKGEETSNGNVEGTGLGLPISKEIIKALGGEIWVSSKINKGSTFYFTIPYQNEEQYSTEEETESSPELLN